MSTGYGPRIVTDELVLCLDAGNNKSYPGNGNTWFDLSGGNNGTISGATYSSNDSASFNFDGNDRITSTNDASLQITIGTIGAWFKATNTNTGVHGIIAKQFAWGLFVWGNVLRAYDWGTGDVRSTSYTVGDNSWHQAVMTFTQTIGSPSNNAIIYLDGVAVLTTTIKHSNHNVTVQIGEANASQFFRGNIAQAMVYNKVLSSNEVSQNYNALKARFYNKYEILTYVASNNLTVTGNGTDTVNIFKTSGANDWNNHAYSSTQFTAPCTIEFNKQAASTNNEVSYAMIGWNSDPLTNASYDTLDYASFPYATNNYSVYHNANQVHFGGTWSTANKFYIVYGTDGTIKHYNGSTLLYSVNYGTGNTVYVDSSFYSVNGTFAGFSNIKVRRSAWNGTTYV